MFRYDPALLEEFPAIQAGVIHATGLLNDPTPGPLLDEYRAEQLSAVARLEQTPIAEIPSIAAWRRAFSRFGVKPTQYRAAAEALLRRLDKRGDIPSISTLVDIGNLISIRYAMPVAVFDQATIAAPTTVRFADGTEEFTDLGSSEVVHPVAGEVIFADTAGVVSARRWCWRQSDQSATRPSTVEALFVIEGHHSTAGDEIEEALDAMASLLETYQPGAETSRHRLNATDPTM